MSRRATLLTAALAAFVLTVAGCGASGDARSGGVAPPQHVPPGAIAVVGSTPVSRTSLRHWLPLLRRVHDPSPDPRKATITFLLKAQWLSQEADLEGINHAVLHQLVARRTAAAPSRPGTSSADDAFQARLDVIAEALEQRHRHAAGTVGAHQIARYYKGHRSDFQTPAVRRTLMIVTYTRAAATRAEAALRAGRPWAAVARRFSRDASALAGGRFPIVAGAAPSEKLQRAAFTAAPGRLVGPLRAMSVAGSRPRYYLFKVTHVTPARRRPLSEVAPRVRATLEAWRDRRALRSFEASFLRRWRARTLCAPGYLVPQCRNYRAGGG